MKFKTFMNTRKTKSRVSKKITMLLGLTALPLMGLSQSTTATNFQTGNRFIGFNNNFPLSIRTNGIQRTKLNGSLNYNINGFNGVRSGYFLIGNNIAPATNYFNGNNSGAFSQLHLMGRDGTFIQEGGYRPWMKTGVTFTDNSH